MADPVTKVIAAVGIAIAGTIFLRPRIPQTPTPKPLEKEPMRSSYGETIPIAWGKSRTTGTILWAGERRAVREKVSDTSGGGKGGKGKGGRKEQKVWTYYQSFAVSFGQASAGFKLEKLWFDSKPIPLPFDVSVPASCTDSGGPPSLPPSINPLAFTVTLHYVPVTLEGVDGFKVEATFTWQPSPRYRTRILDAALFTFPGLPVPEIIPADVGSIRSVLSPFHSVGARLDFRVTLQYIDSGGNPVVGTSSTVHVSGVAPLRVGGQNSPSGHQNGNGAGSGEGGDGPGPDSVPAPPPEVSGPSGNVGGVRFYPKGGECPYISGPSQPLLVNGVYVDPLIPSGVAHTDLSYMVIEDLLLTSYGNRIPSVSVSGGVELERVPDPLIVPTYSTGWKTIHRGSGPSAIAVESNIVRDVVISCGLDPESVESSVNFGIGGYGATREITGKSVLEPLLRFTNLYPVEREGRLAFVEAGSIGSVTHIAEEELLRIEEGTYYKEDHTEITELPETVELSYLAAEREYQTNTARAKRVSDLVETSDKVSLRIPATLDVSRAKQAVEKWLQTAWEERVTFVLLLPPEVSRSRACGYCGSITI